MTTILTLSVRETYFAASQDLYSVTRNMMNDRALSKHRKTTITLSDSSLRLDLKISPLRETSEISIQGRTFTDLGHLIRELPGILEHPTLLAKLIHYVEIGLEYNYIEDAESIKGVMQEEAHCPPEKGRGYCIEQPCLSQIQKPFFSENSLVFFVTRQGAPYRVRCTFPTDDALPEIDLEKI
ncbi:hypothetical protein [Estrella lausannensis]|uniref:Uncharacterized protein n=1 Tax=Estrella lausannensis TaxID=483423 RepID=A0A0H5DPV7_9BACT|nr:hypothetical protein [Estrella lausannensis]CRX38063.1 hypothetical protein ELAC_0711 [Estrella lausannensis]